MSGQARSSGSADPLLDAAVGWKARLASGDLSPVERRTFETWQAQNVHHARAADLVEAKVASVRDAIAGDDVLARIETRSRGEAASPIRPLTIALPEHREPLRAGWDFRTTRGEVIDLVAEDGSYVRLQPSSAVNVAFDDGIWTLNLRCGVVFISRSPQAPGTMLFSFSTDVGGVLRVERGTEATVEMRASEVVCTVASGCCIVTTDDNDEAIEAGFGTSFNRHRSHPEQADIDEAFDWVEDRLIARSRPLRAVIDRMRPLSPVPIVVDKALEDRTIEGEYRPRDTEASLRLIADHLRATLHCGRDRYTLGDPAGA